MSLLRPSTSGFADNLNVVVIAKEMPITDKSVNQLLASLPQQYKSMGATIENLQAHTAQLGNNKAIVIDYRAALPGHLSTMQQHQASFAGGGNTFIVTCTSTPESYAASAGAFDTMLASFKIPPSQGFDFERSAGKSFHGRGDRRAGQHRADDRQEA